MGLAGSVAGLKMRHEGLDSRVRGNDGSVWLGGLVLCRRAGPLALLAKL